MVRNNLINQRFIDDIIDSPNDNSLRLIYADWLEDNGNKDKADFIRLQIDLHYGEPGYSLDWSSNIRIHDNSVNAKIKMAIDLYRKIIPEENISWALIANSNWSRGFISSLKIQYRQIRDKEMLRLLCCHPIEKIEITDKKPFGGFWCCRKYFLVENEVELDIYKFLVGKEEEPRRKTYKNNEDAIMDLSDACLKFVRGEINARRMEGTVREVQI